MSNLLIRNRRQRVEPCAFIEVKEHPISQILLHPIITGGVSFVDRVHGGVRLPQLKGHSQNLRYELDHGLSDSNRVRLYEPDDVFFAGRECEGASVFVVVELGRASKVLDVHELQNADVFGEGGPRSSLHWVR